MSNDLHYSTGAGRTIPHCLRYPSVRVAAEPSQPIISMHRPVRAEVPPSRGSSGETGDAARSERLPMEATGGIRPIVGPDRSGRCQRRRDWPIETPAKAGAALAQASLISTFISEERRVGQECISPYRSRWSAE